MIQQMPLLQRSKKTQHNHETSSSAIPTVPVIAASAAATVAPIIAVAPTHNIVASSFPTTHSASSTSYSTTSTSFISSAPPPPLPPPLPPGPPPQYNPNQTNKIMKRTAAGSSWIDPTLAEFPPNDFRLFIGNLPKDIQLQQLEQFFSSYSSFAMAKICMNKHDGKSKGYGFVSMLDPMDAARAAREKDQKWLGSRPIRVRMSDWKDRDSNAVTKKRKKNAKKGRNRLW